MPNRNFAAARRSALKAAYDVTNAVEAVAAKENRRR
jgi:hypothetical protein